MRFRSSKPGREAGEASRECMANAARGGPGGGGGGIRESGCGRGPDSQSAEGVALVAALLTLASLMTLALATTLLLSFDLKLVSNRQERAVARARATSNLNLALLELESAAVTGELQETAPATPGLVDYRRLEEGTAVVQVEGREGSARHLAGARIELRRTASGWRVHIVERR